MLVESMLGSGFEGFAVEVGGEEWGDIQMISGEAGAKLMHRGEPVTLRGLEWSGERGGPAELGRETEGPSVCRLGLWTGLC